MAVIHLDHIKNNALQLKSLLQPDVFFCPMIKANAYGHGAFETAEVLKEIGVKSVGVALVEEGLELRQRKCDLDILVFGGFDQQSVHQIISHRLTPVISTWKQLLLLQDQLQSQSLSAFPVHIKFDTGMNRWGFDPEDADRLVQSVQISKLKVHGILTHLHSGEDADQQDGHSFEQLQIFSLIEKKFSHLKVASHVLNSSGIVQFSKHSKSALDKRQINLSQGARPGLSLYGASSLNQNIVDLKPAMSFRSEVAKYKKVKKGQGVSYGISWRAAQDSVIGLIPVGYADGYKRALSNQSEILFRGKRAPIVGVVCMDYMMTDLTALVKEPDLNQLAPEPVTLWGHDQFGNCIQIEEIAKKANTIPWEIMTSVSNRVPRVFVREAEKS